MALVPHLPSGEADPLQDGPRGSMWANLDRQCPSARLRTFEARQTVYGQGTSCADVFIVVSGQVKLARVDGEGNEFTTGLFSAGDPFGPGLAGTDAREAQETAVTNGPVSLWQVPVAAFHTLLLEHPALCLGIMELLARRQRQTERRLVGLAFKRTEARLAETLRELSGGFDLRCEHGFGQHLRITQQELADLVGASRPVVSTILNRLRKAGVLGYSREYLCVRSIEAIEHLVGH